MMTDVTPNFNFPTFSVDNEVSMPSPGSSDARSLEMADQNINTQQNNLRNSITNDLPEMIQETESEKITKKRKMENEPINPKRNKRTEDFNRMIFFQPQTKLDRYYIIKYNKNKVDATNGIGAQNALKEILGDEPRKVLKNGLHTLLVETKNQSQNNKILDIKELANEEVTVNIHPTFNGSKGVVRSKMLSNATEEERFEHLKQYGVTDCRRMKATIDGTLKETDTYILTFNTEFRPTHIPTAYGLREEVKPYEERPRRCFKCQKFGHGAKWCKSELEHCSKCSEIGHSSKNENPCNKPTKCANCEGAHTAFNKKCPKYLAECAILNTMNEEKIPRINAIQKVKTKFPEYEPYLIPFRKKQIEDKNPPNDKGKVTSQTIKNKRPLAGFLGQPSMFASYEETFTDAPSTSFDSNFNKPTDQPSNEKKELNQEQTKYILDFKKYIGENDIFSPPPPPAVKPPKTKNTPIVNTEKSNGIPHLQKNHEANAQNANTKENEIINEEAKTKHIKSFQNKIHKPRQSSIPIISKSTEKSSHQFVNNEFSFSDALKNNDTSYPKKETVSSNLVTLSKTNIPIKQNELSSTQNPKTSTNHKKDDNSKSKTRRRTQSQDSSKKDK